MEVVEPPLELEAVVRAEPEHLRNCVGAVDPVQEGVHQACVVVQIRRDLEVAERGVPLGHGLEEVPDHLQPFRVLLGPQDAEDLLQHVHAKSSVLAVQHETHDAVRREDVPQTAQAPVRVRQVMEDPCRDDQIERLSEVFDILDWQLPELQIGKDVLLLQKPLVVQRRLGDIDTDDMGVGIREGVVRRLVGSATGDGDLEGRRLDVPRPELSTEQGGVAALEYPLVDGGAEIRERRGVGPALVLRFYGLACVSHLLVGAAYRISNWKWPHVAIC